MDAGLNAGDLSGGSWNELKQLGDIKCNHHTFLIANGCPACHGYTHNRAGLTLRRDDDVPSRDGGTCSHNIKLSPADRWASVVGKIFCAVFLDTKKSPSQTVRTAIGRAKGIRLKAKIYRELGSSSVV